MFFDRFFTRTGKYCTLLKKVKFNWSTFWLMIFGLAVLIGAYLMEENLNGYWYSIGGHLATELGIALLSVAIIGVVIETRHWSEYFRTKLMEIIVSPENIAQLNDYRIKIMQMNIFRRQYGEHVVAKDSMLDYFNRKLLSEIAIPFREDYSLQIDVEFAKDSEGLILKDMLQYSECLSYRCRACNGNIQERIVWSYMDDFVNGFIIEAWIKLPNGDKKVLVDSKQTIKKNGDGECVFTYDLKDYLNQDGLEVMLRTIYQGPARRPWKNIFTYPLRNIKCVSVQYAPELKVDLLYLGIDTALLIEKKTARSYSANYPEWCLRNYGMVIHVDNV